MIPAGANRPTAVAASRKSNGLLAASAALITSILIAATMALNAGPAAAADPGIDWTLQANAPARYR